MEPAHGALLRLCVRSGSTAVSSFARSLGLNLRDVLAGRDVARIVDLAGLPLAATAWRSPLVSAAERVVTIGGEELSLGDWSIASRRHCPECLLADVSDADALGVPADWLAHHRNWWDVRSITACPEHGVALVDACPRCSHQVGWRDARRLSCPRCHADLLADPTPLKDPLGAYVAARLGVGRAARPPVLDGLPLRHAVRLCGKLGRAGLDTSPDATTAGVPTPEVGREGFRRAAAGPEGLDDVFDRVLARRAGDAPDGLGGAYGWLHDEWLGTGDPTAGPYREALRRHAVAHGVIAQDEGRLGAEPPPTISLTGAAAQAGVAFARMRRALDEAGAIPSGSRRGVSFALDPDVVAMAVRPRGAVRRAAREVLGVGRTALTGLGLSGHLDLTDECTLRASATRLLSAVARELCAGAPPKGVTPLQAATVATSVSLPRVVEALLQGRIPAWEARDGVGLSSILVRTVDLAPLRARADGGFTGVTAARALGLHQECVRALTRGGVLPRGDDGLIASNTVEEFRAKYVAGGELARARGCSPMRLIEDLAAEGIDPAWPLASHRQAVFRRADLGHRMRPQQ